MTKRTQNNDDKSNNKRPKLNDDLEELWGDELDESVLEDCIKLASQVINEDQNRENESFLSTYDVFKVPPRPMFSSTQINSSIGPTTSKDSNAHFTQSRNGSESEIQRLKMQCAEKDGEVAILRTQLRETKAQSNIEFIKTSSEWKAKLSLSEKQVQAIKSELEFKNLEIANLKQKILGLSRHSLNKTFSNDDTPDIKASCSKETLAISPRRNEVKKLYATTNIDFPLKKTWTNSFLSISKTEKFIINNKLFHSFNNGIPYLQNKTVSTRVILNTNKADVHSIYPIILKVCESTELGSESYISGINTIICVGLQSLEDLLELLQEIKNNLRTEDLLEVDSLYLIDEDINCDYKSDLGRRAAFVLNFLAALLPYSSYLKNYFIHNKLLDLRKQVDLIKNIPCISTKKAHSGQDFLNKLVSILNIAGEIRKANVMSTFLKASIKLFNNICKLNGYTHLSQTVCKFTKELIFSRPLVNVTFELTYLLKEVSRHTTFVQYLLNKSNGTTNTKNGILRFNEDACRFYIFVFLFHRSLSKKRTVPPEICLNILSFIYNTYKFSYFLHHVDVKECKCLQQLYKLVIELIFRTLETYTEEVKLNNRPNFFNSKIVLNVLNLMSFHRYELIEKYMTLYSQFKEIERMLSENEVLGYQSEDKMELRDINYDKAEYVETASGNKVCRQTVLCGSQNIVLQGKVIVQSDAIIRGDLANVKTGRYCIISKEAVLRPPYKKFSKGVAFFPLSMGDHVYVGEKSLVNAAIVGNYVYIGKNCVIGRRCSLKDCCVIEDNTILAPETVVPPFTRYGGSPGAYVGDLPECQADLMVDFTKSYYQHFQPTKLI